MTLRALVLAGSRPGVDSLAESENVPHKALIDLAGKTMLARVISALKESSVEEILVASNDPEVARAATELGATPVSAEQGPSATVLSTVRQFGAPLIVTTSDHGLLQGDWVDLLMHQTRDGLDMGIMMASCDLIKAELPHSKRTYLRFSDGNWSGCNLFYLKTPQAAAAIELWSMVEKDRKKPWKIAARLGPGTLLSMLVGRLSVGTAIGRLGDQVDAKVGVVPAPSGLAAVDADTRLDLADMRSVLEQRESLAA
ncbi:nucleotidyltransferase family protein [Erythrobacter rubeus]|uniref:Nucleotidyltransferase family protein n=1 Tax=Erythrobacter rubeus TaxID=2760803 RepID=A0ABR8KTV0_9SPHN|nr:NTP transferase domain-containing protein [Erythrobacter rubeus]MBD2841677.1 nucleotidyltransferase family protein [Erythrobacter rubeus]